MLDTIKHNIILGEYDMKKTIILAYFFVLALMINNVYAKNLDQCALVLNGVSVEISGIVAAVPAGDGLKVDIGTEVVTVYGLGPIWYWNDIGVDRPTIGDQVEIDARIVVFSDGTEKTIMMTIEVNGTLVELRDPVTGCPLWW